VAFIHALLPTLSPSSAEDFDAGRKKMKSERTTAIKSMDQRTHEAKIKIRKSLF
jgi:hypothetical protein